MDRQTRNTWIFIGLLLLAGAANLYSRTGVYAWDSLMSCTNYMIYTGLLLYWIEAVRFRLLPSGAKTCVLSAGFLMLGYMLVRIFKYRFAVNTVTMRYAVYAYWIPQILIPALFLMTCIRIRHSGKESRKDNLVLIPAALLVLLAMTNDLHSLVYVPNVPLSAFDVTTGTYSYAPGFYLLHAWVILALGTGMVLLFLHRGSLPGKASLILAADFLLWYGLQLGNIFIFERVTLFRAYNTPEIYTFGVLGFFEVCIRYRLIPYNENYAGFFRSLKIPAVITDRELQPVYASETCPETNRKILSKVLQGPAFLTPDMKVCGKEIRAGYAFWAEDESAVHRMQDRLLEANEMIDHENDLIRTETEQKEKDAYLQSRHRIYHEIAEKLYPVQKRISHILEQAEPGTADFRNRIADVSVLNAYVKRKTNLLLLAEENETLSLGELYLALQESANYLTLAGLHTTAGMQEERQLPSAVIIGLYDAFECIAEQLKGKVPSLMVSWNGKFLRLAAETDFVPDTEDIALPVQFHKSEDILYADIFAREGGDAS
ncbi:MAG: hypothetical protein K6G61_12440 [Solobacterium sp.]|nr:hypothetical protein [Solobacterium sp.]